MTELKKQVLGRGLSSLLGSSEEAENNDQHIVPKEMLIEIIKPWSKQPRRLFEEEEIQALSLSILDKGVLQPIIVRPHTHLPNQYEIVAGERRWRAAQLANLKRIPTIIREFTDAEALEVSLLENLQRQNLNPIEEASGYRRLAEDYKHTQETLSRVVGKSRSHIANSLRLLTLPEKVQNYLKEGQLSAGHGRAILAADNPQELADMIVEEGLSVREAERLSKRNSEPGHSRRRNGVTKIYPKTRKPKSSVNN